MSQAFVHEYNKRLAALLMLLADAGVKPYHLTPNPASLDDLWVPLRPAMQVLRVPKASQRCIEKHIRLDVTTGKVTLQWYWPNPLWGCLLIPTDYFTGHIVYYGEHEACWRFVSWRADVHVALMHHGTYNPATHHEPEPGHELDALELREHLQATFDECFPGFSTLLPRYRLVRDDDGHVTAEPITPDDEEEDDAIS